MSSISQINNNGQPIANNNTNANADDTLKNLLETQTTDSSNEGLLITTRPSSTQVHNYYHNLSNRDYTEYDFRLMRSGIDYQLQVNQVTQEEHDLILQAINAKEKGNFSYNPVETEATAVQAPTNTSTTSTNTPVQKTTPSDDQWQAWTNYIQQLGFVQVTDLIKNQPSAWESLKSQFGVDSMSSTEMFNKVKGKKQGAELQKAGIIDIGKPSSYKGMSNEDANILYSQGIISADAHNKILRQNRWEANGEIIDLPLTSEDPLANVNWISKEDVSHLIPEWKISQDGQSMVMDRNVSDNHKKLLMQGRTQAQQIEEENIELFNEIIEKFENEGVAPTKELYLLFKDSADKNKGKVVIEHSSVSPNVLAKQAQEEHAKKMEAYGKTYENMKDDPYYTDLKDSLKSQDEETVGKVYKLLKSDAWWMRVTAPEQQGFDNTKEILHIRNSLSFWDTKDDLTFVDENKFGHKLLSNWNDVDWGNENWAVKEDDSLNSYIDRVSEHLGISWDENGNVVEEKVNKQAVIAKKNADYLRTSWTPLENMNYLSKKIEDMRNNGELISAGMYTQLGIFTNVRSQQISDWIKQGRLPAQGNDMGTILRQLDQEYAESIGRTYLGPKGDPVNSTTSNTSNTIPTQNTQPEVTIASNPTPSIPQTTSTQPAVEETTSPATIEEPTTATTSTSTNNETIPAAATSSTTSTQPIVEKALQIPSIEKPTSTTPSVSTNNSSTNNQTISNSPTAFYNKLNSYTLITSETERKLYEEISEMAKNKTITGEEYNQMVSAVLQRTAEELIESKKKIEVEAAKQSEVKAFEQLRNKIWKNAENSALNDTTLNRENFDKDTQDGIAFITNGFIQGLDPVSDNVFRAAAYNYVNDVSNFGSYNNSNLVRASQIAKFIVDWEKQNGFTNVLHDPNTQNQDNTTTVKPPTTLPTSSASSTPNTPQSSSTPQTSPTISTQEYREKVAFNTAKIEIVQLGYNGNINLLPDNLEFLSDLKNELLEIENKNAMVIKDQISKLGFQGDANSLPNNIAYLTNIRDNLLKAMQNKLTEQNKKPLPTNEITSLQDTFDSYISYRIPGTNQIVSIPKSIAMQGTNAIQRYVAMKFDIRKPMVSYSKVA